MLLKVKLNIVPIRIIQTENNKITYLITVHTFHFHIKLIFSLRSTTRNYNNERTKYHKRKRRKQRRAILKLTAFQLTSR